MLILRVFFAFLASFVALFIFIRLQIKSHFLTLCKSEGLYFAAVGWRLAKPLSRPTTTRRKSIYKANLLTRLTVSQGRGENKFTRALCLLFVFPLFTPFQADKGKYIRRKPFPTLGNRGALLQDCTFVIFVMSLWKWLCCFWSSALVAIMPPYSFISSMPILLNLLRAS